MRSVTMLVVLAGVVLLTSYPMGGLATDPSGASKANVLKIGNIVYEGGDGSSIEKAVIIKNAKNTMEGVRAESDWIAKVHPGWKKGNQALISHNGRHYDRIQYTTPSGETKTIYFDITEFFGKF